MLATLGIKPITLIALCILLLSAIYNIFIPLHGDEAYYWLFSKHLQWGYYDHPALIAYYIHLFTYFSDDIFFVRLGNIVAYGIVLFVIYRIGITYLNQHSARFALLVLLSVPLFHAATLIITPDTVLMLTYALTLHFTLRAITSNQWHDFLLAGLFLGLSMMAKYTGVLMAGTIIVYALLYQRSLFYSVKFYAAMLVAILFVSPLIWWNYQHEWISFLFQLHHGGMGKESIHVDKFLAFFGGQVGIFTPVFFFVALFMAITHIRHVSTQTKRVTAFLSVAFLVPLLFFSYKSFYQSMEINYAAPIYIAASLLNGLFFAQRIGAKKVQTVLLGSLAFALVLSLMARYAMLFHLLYVQDRMVGFKEAIHTLAQYRQKGDALYGNHLTTAALLTYYLKEHPKTDVGIDSRFSQYDLWRQNTTRESGLFLSYEPIDNALLKAFESFTLLDTYPVYKSDTVFKTFYIYRVNAKLTAK